MADTNLTEAKTELIVDQMQALIDSANETTGKNDTTLTDSVQSLKEGYYGSDVSLKTFTWEKYSAVGGSVSGAYVEQEVANKSRIVTGTTMFTLYSGMTFNADTGVYTLSGSSLNSWSNVYNNKIYETHPYYYVNDEHTKIAKITSMKYRSGVVVTYDVIYNEYYSIANQPYAKGEYIEDVTSTSSDDYPANGYQDGYRYVLKGDEPKLQDKVITENGTYQADSGYDGLGSVTVEVASGGGSSGGFTTKSRKFQLEGDIYGQAISFSNIPFEASLDNIVMEG